MAESQPPSDEIEFKDEGLVFREEQTQRKEQNVVTNWLRRIRNLARVDRKSAARRDAEALRDLNAKLDKKAKELEETLGRKELALGHQKAQERLAELEKAHKEVQVENVVSAIAAAESVDLAFIVDCTHSMKPHISAVKESLQLVVGGVRKTHRDLKLRIAVVAYRDLHYVVQSEIMDFDESVSRFQSFLSNVQAGGKLKVSSVRDSPEDMAGGLRNANNLSWQSPTRVAIIVADFPCHGLQFHNLKDDYPDGTPGINVLEELASLAKLSAANGTMSLFLGRITKHTDKMIEEFKKVATLSV